MSRIQLLSPVNFPALEPSNQRLCAARQQQNGSWTIFHFPGNFEVNGYQTLAEDNRTNERQTPSSIPCAKFHVLTRPMSSVYRKRRRDAEDRGRESESGRSFEFGEWNEATLHGKSQTAARELSPPQATTTLAKECGPIVQMSPNHLTAEEPQRALLSVQELASGKVYTKPLKAIGGWRAPSRLRSLTRSDAVDMLKNMSVSMEGTQCPPPCAQFSDLRLPSKLAETLRTKNILAPSPIQTCGLPALLSGRDFVGIASTGSGKTLCFSLPLVLHAMHQNVHLPLQGGEGPLGLVLCPSRELAKQTATFIRMLLNAVNVHEDEERSLRCLVAIGGEAYGEQGRSPRDVGYHICVATPGRLCDLLARGNIDLSLCRYLVLDEADRMLDIDGFEEEVRTVLSYFRGQRQTALFSATMPRRVHRFARTALVDPITVQVGRSGSANYHVVQEIEFVSNEQKLKRTLDCLQKTAPPTVIFCDKKEDVDLIHEYCLLKGVDACAVHGGMAQEDRSASIGAFRMQKKDVLVATDVASKGLDFPGVMHVINFHMPKEIENYVHRIGRTGRAGKPGVATTFIEPFFGNQAVLMDLRQLLQESKQPLPPGLAEGGGASESLEHGGIGDKGVGPPVIGCEYCGGLGHSMQVCPKLEKGRMGRISRVEGPRTRRGTVARDY